MQQPPAYATLLVRDTLDRAIMLCRLHARKIVSHLIAVQCINLALLSLLFPLLGLPASPLMILGVPLYVGNPFSLFDTLFFRQRGLDLRVAGILIADTAIIITCLRVLFIARFAQPGQPHLPLPATAMGFTRIALKVLLPSSVLLAIAAATVVLIRIVIPFSPLIFVLSLRPPMITLALLLLASTLFVLTSPLIGGRFALAPQMIMLEHCGGVRGLLRSWQLTRYVWRSVFGLVLLLDGPLVLVLLLPLLWRILDLALSKRGGSLFAFVGLGTLVLGLLALVIVPFQTAAMTILYDELRQRIEGADLEERIQAITPISTSESTKEHSYG